MQWLSIVYCETGYCFIHSFPFSLHSFHLCVPASIAAFPSTLVIILRTSPCTLTPVLTMAVMSTPSSSTPCLGVAGVTNTVREISPLHVGRNARCVGSSVIPQTSVWSDTKQQSHYHIMIYDQT